MLSRVAERIYWIGRYLERAENTARLINVYASLILDLPKEAPIKWDMLPNIMGGSDTFKEQHTQCDERNVCKFLLTDVNFAGSVLSSVMNARENARTSREVLPNEAWEMINELYLYIQESQNMIQSRNKRALFLEGVVARCQKITGMITCTMTRDDVFHFMLMGRELERADMTTRIIDTGITTALEMSEELYTTYEYSVWIYILDALGAVQMFRKIVRDRIDRQAVLEFLLLNRFYPRSIFYCLDGVEQEIHMLPTNHEVQRAISHSKLHLKKIPVESLEKEKLQIFLDDVQLNFNNIHKQITNCWFKLEYTQQQEQQA